MSPESRETLRRGGCPGCDKPANGKLRHCRRCGEVLCENCWIGGKFLCADCITDLDREGSSEEQYMEEERRMAA